jgi:hypothetical protein
LGRLEIANISIIWGAGIFFILLATLINVGSVEAKPLAWAIVFTELSVLTIRLFYWGKITHQKRKEQLL